MARNVTNRPKFSPQNYYRTPPNDQPNPSREQRRQDTSVKRRRLGRVARVMLLAVLAWSLWFFGTVSGVRVESNAPEQNSALAEQLATKVSGWRSIKPLINPGGLSDELSSSDGSIADVRLSWSLGSRQLYADVVWRQPVAVAVAGSEQLGLIGQDGVFYVDQTVSDLPPIEDNSGLTPDNGQQFVPIRTLDFIRLVEQSLVDLPQDMRSSRRYRLVESAREVHLLSSRKFVVKLNIDRAAADQMQELVESLEYLKKQKRTPSAYIDLRIDDTAYYR